MVKTTATCPICGATFTRIHTQNKPPVYCSRACANKAPGRMTEEIKAKIGQAIQAELHPNWTNGSWTDRDGRVYIRVAVEERHLHPTIRSDGYIKRYHYIWNLNNPDDPVRSHEIIHHVNHDKTDDRIENLRKWNQSEHAHYHGLGKLHSDESRQLMSIKQKERRERERAARS